jgi:hypothetical protein
MRSVFEVYRRCIAFSNVFRVATSTDAIGPWAVVWFFICWFASVYRASMGLGKMVSGATVHEIAQNTKLIRRSFVM